MAVIINEFEVVVEPPASAPAADPEETGGSDTEPRVLAPYEHARLMLHALERQLRVAAD